MLRRLKGILGTGLAWSIPWSALGAAGTAASVWWAVRTGAAPPSISVLGPSIAAAVFYGLVGLWAGVVFALCMLVSERRSPFDALRVSRVAVWGALGGLSFPAVGWILSTFDESFTVTGALYAFIYCGVLGAASGTAMLWVARRAGTEGVAALSAPLPDFTEVKLTEQERSRNAST